jgi:hypothetical protein
MATKTYKYEVIIKDKDGYVRDRPRYLTKKSAQSSLARWKKMYGGTATIKPLK